MKILGIICVSLFIVSCGSTPKDVGPVVIEKPVMPAPPEILMKPPLLPQTIETIVEN